MSPAFGVMLDWCDLSILWTSRVLKMVFLQCSRHLIVTFTAPLSYYEPGLKTEMIDYQNFSSSITC